MKGFIIGLALSFSIAATANYVRSYESHKTTIEGTTCIIVQNSTGIGVSCDWR